MFSRKQKLITVVTTLALGYGFTLGVTPSSAETTSNINTVFMQEDQVRIQIPFTGYVIAADGHYLIVADTTSKEEAISYQNDWWKLVSQNKILRVPIKNTETYMIGEKLNVFSVGWTHSIPPIAVMPIIERIR